MPLQIIRTRSEDSVQPTITLLKQCVIFSSDVFIYVVQNMQGELEHRCSKRRYARSGKKKGSMVGSIANQEAMERFIWSRMCNFVATKCGNYRRNPLRRSR